MIQYIGTASKESRMYIFQILFCSKDSKSNRQGEDGHSSYTTADTAVLTVRILVVFVTFYLQMALYPEISCRQMAKFFCSLSGQECFCLLSSDYAHLQGGVQCTLYSVHCTVYTSK